MTPAEQFAADRRALELTQSDFAEICGVTARAVRKWEAEGAPRWAGLILRQFMAQGEHARAALALELIRARYERQQ